MPDRGQALRSPAPPAPPRRSAPSDRTRTGAEPDPDPHTGPRQRFLLAGPLPPPAFGNSVQFETLCSALRRRGHDCRVVNLTRRTGSAPSRLSLARSTEVLRALARFVLGLARGHRRVYLIVAQSGPGFLRDALMIWSARAFGSRITAHILGGNCDGYYHRRSPLRRFLIRRTLRQAHRIVVESGLNRQRYAFDGAIGERMTVVPNSPPAPLQGRARTLRGGGGGPIRVLFLSNMIQSKGYDHVLDALAILRRTSPVPFEAVFAGRFEASADDPAPLSPEAAEARFRTRLDDPGLGGTARYAGPVSGPEKWRLFETSDFFVLPTNYVNESLPVSIVEAMAHGCVVVATGFRAIPDLVVDGVTGALVEYGRPDRIADAVGRLAADPEAYARMSRAAVERYESRFTLQHYLDRLVPLLEDA